MKKPLDDLTKAKYIYSGELLAFSVAFTVLGILTMTGVIGVSENRVNWITWITLVGGSLLIANTIWFFCSKKKRAKGSWLDTLIILPVPLTMIRLRIHSWWPLLLPHHGVCDRGHLPLVQSSPSPR